MLRRVLLLVGVVAAMALSVGTLNAADLTESLKKGTPTLKSAGALAFGPDGILFIGDATSASIFAVATGDTKAGGKGDVKLEKIDDQIASMLGTMPTDISINDVKVNPVSGNIFLSVGRGKGPGATPVIVKVDRAGKLSQFELKDVPFASVSLSNATDKQRAEAITSMAFIKDRLIVAGLSNEEFASKLRAIPFPFKESDKGSSVEIYHGAHGKLETNAPVRTFTPFDVNGETNIMAAYTCTPLVKIPVSDLKPGEKVKGKTVAELGNRNRPLDMIAYKKGDKNFLLIANSARGVMKVSMEGVDKTTPITTRIADKAGLTYDTIADLKDVMQLDKLDDTHALLLVKTGTNFKLESIVLP